VDKLAIVILGVVAAAFVVIRAWLTFFDKDDV
jgi:hypothetical protein